MALSIKSPEADRLARELAEKTGESITDAIIIAMRERLAREERKKRDTRRLAEDLLEIGRHCASLPVYDTRSSDEILGYDENGLPS
jgi:antitoxin VapB